MRLKLLLNHPPNQVLPINYQYLISSWIYYTLKKANFEFAKKLHSYGYDFNGKKYKLFSFGPLCPRWFNINKRKGTFILAKSPTVLELSFFVDEAVQHFVAGLFKNQRLNLSTGKFQVDLQVGGIEILPSLMLTNTMRFQTQTPICISTKLEEKEHATYLHPKSEEYAGLLLQNLLRKQKAFQSETVGIDSSEYESNFPFDFKVLSNPKPKLISIKGTKVRGYLFDFEMTASKELMKVGYYGGMGEKNSSLGFGMVKVLK